MSEDTNVDGLIKTRGSTHGPWRKQLDLVQKLKNHVDLKQNVEWLKVNTSNPARANVIKECLESLALKMSRIATGDPYAIEHWEDVEGYARIALKELRDEAERLQEANAIQNLLPEVTKDELDHIANLPPPTTECKFPYKEKEYEYGVRKEQA